MKKRFSEEQIIGFLKEADAGMPVVDLCQQRFKIDTVFHQAAI